LPDNIRIYNLFRMKPFFSLALFLCLQVLSFAQPEEFISLFNGKNLEGWWGLDTVNPETWINLPEEDLAQKRANSLTDIQKHWRVENQELVNDGKGLYLTTIQNFADFELQLEYKTVPLADSGIYLRGYPQVQIWDTTEAGGKWKFGAEKGSGGLWNNRPGDGWQPSVHADKPFGEWNHFRIIMKGDRVTIFLNQQLVVKEAILVNYWHKKTKKPILSEGPIQLQTHGGEIRWRNLYLKELS